LKVLLERVWKEFKFTKVSLESIILIELLEDDLIKLSLSCKLKKDLLVRIYW
jgi:hypothetical protein